MMQSLRDKSERHFVYLVPCGPFPKRTQVWDRYGSSNSVCYTCS